MFSLFRKSRRTITEKVWKTKQACYRGLATDALLCISKGEIPLIIVFFSEDFENLASFLEASKAPMMKIEGQFFGNAIESKRSIIVADAQTVSPAVIKRIVDNGTGIRILFLGHHPMIRVENELLDAITAPESNRPVQFHLSLDDALLKWFGSDRIRPMMDSLGMKDDECIEHAMVGKAIARAREKISEKVTVESKARSEEDWFKKNMKPISQL